MSNPNTRKSCVVPKCKNTTTNSPEKLFFIVPKDVKMRKKWIKAMKRLDPFGDKSTVYCCEDHFDIENDMENYTKYKLVGGRIKLKQGIVPHKFKCQQEKEDKPQRSAVQKRNRIEYFEKLLNKDETSALEKPEETLFASCEDEIVIEDPLSCWRKLLCNKSIDNSKGTAAERDRTADGRKGSSQELDKFKRRMIRSVARLVHIEKKEDEEVWQELKKETGSQCKVLWFRMHALTVKKLQRLLLADDLINCIPAVARMTMTDWLLFDLVLVHDKIDVIGRYEENRPESSALGKLFNLVQRFNIEYLSGDDLLDAWTAAVKFYNRGRMCSPMLLQKRWYQLKELTRYNFYKFWQLYRGNVKLAEKAKPHTPAPLQRAIATRYPHVITQPFENWEQLIEKRKVILPDEFFLVSPCLLVQKAAHQALHICQKIVLESELYALDIKLKLVEESRGNRQLPNPCSDDDPDLILIEPHVETIDLGNDDEDSGDNKDESEKSKSSETNITDSEIIKDTEDLNSKIDIKYEPIDIEDTVIEESVMEEHLSKPDRLMQHEDEVLKEIETAEQDITESIETCHEIVDNVTEPEIIHQNSEVDELVEVPMAQTNYDTELALASEPAFVSETVKVPAAIEPTIQPIESTDNNIAIEEDLNTATKTSLENVDDDIMETIPSENNDQMFNGIEQPNCEIQLPLITNVVGNVDIEGGDLSHITSLNDNSAANVSPPLSNKETHVTEDEDDADDIIQVTDYGKRNQKELETNLIPLSISDDKKDGISKSSQSEDLQTNKLDIVTSASRSDAENFIDDDIEFVDDGIVEVDCDDSSSETDKKSNCNEDDIDDKKTSPTFDLKLLMNPVIYTTKLDQMASLKDIPFAEITVNNILDDIIAESKPKPKETVKIEVQKEVIKSEEIKIEPEDIIKSTDEVFNNDDILQNDDCDSNASEEDEDIDDNLKVKRTSFLFKKPINRQYHPIQLCKNPDFNTRLRRLNLGFFSHTRNIRLLKFCKPLTIDVYKAFEDKLINGTLYLKGQETNDQGVKTKICDKETVQVTQSITPSAVPVQSLVNGTETDANEIIAEVKANARKPIVDMRKLFEDKTYGKPMEDMITTEDYPTLTVSRTTAIAPMKTNSAGTELKHDKSTYQEVHSQYLEHHKNGADISSNSTLKAKHLYSSEKTPIPSNSIPSNPIPSNSIPSNPIIWSKNSTKKIVGQEKPMQIMSELSRKKMTKKNKAHQVRGPNWLATGTKPPPARLDDFLIASDTLTKMLILMNGGGAITFQELVNMKARKIRTLKTKKTLLENELAATKTVKETSTSCVDTKVKNAPMEQCENDKNCTCITCVEKCSCPACKPTETKLNVKKVKTCKSKVLAAPTPTGPVIPKKKKSIEATNNTKLNMNTTKSSQGLRQRNPNETTKDESTQINTLTKNRKAAIRVLAEEQKTKIQNPVAHIRILAKNNSVGIEADPGTTEMVPTNTETNLTDKVRHIVIDGTKPLMPNLNSSFDHKNPIYLGQNKILMTTTKFPESLEGVKERKSLPLSYTNLLHPNLQLPPGVNLQLLPNGEYSLAIDPNASLTAQQQNMLPVFLETINKISKSTVLANSKKDQCAARDPQNTSDEIVISDDEEKIPSKEDEEKINDDTIGPQVNDVSVIISPNRIHENTLTNSNINQELNISAPTVTDVKTQPLGTLSSEQIPVAICPQAQSKENDNIDEEQINREVIDDNINNSVDISSGIEKSVDIDSTDSTTDAGQLVESEANNRDNQETSKTSSSTVNRKSLLSDLMEMSGISLEDVLPTNPVNIAPVPVLTNITSTVDSNEAMNNISSDGYIKDIEIQQNDSALRITAEIDCQIVQNVTITSNVTANSKTNLNTNTAVPKIYELNIVSSYAKLKYVCENHGDFYKLDLDTGFINKINVCIKKKIVHKTKITSNEQIDLTDEPDASTNLPEKQNIRRIAASKITIRNNLFPQKNQPTLDSIRKIGVRFPIPIRKLQNKSILKTIDPNFTVTNNEIPQGNELKRFYFKEPLILRKRAPVQQEINLIDSDMESMEEEYLLDSDAEELQDNTVNQSRIQPLLKKIGVKPIAQLKKIGVKPAVQSNIDSQSDDDSDDEPLAKKAKRIHRIDDNDSGIQLTQGTTNIQKIIPIKPITNTIPQVPIHDLENFVRINNLPMNTNLPSIVSQVRVMPFPEPMNDVVGETLVPAYSVPHGLIPEPMNDVDVETLVPTYSVHGLTTAQDEDCQNDASVSGDEDCILGF